MIFTVNNNHRWTLANASYDPETGKVTGLCVDEVITNRLFHAVSHQKGTNIGKEITLPQYGRCEKWQWEQRRCDQAWCG